MKSLEDQLGSKSVESRKSGGEAAVFLTEAPRSPKKVGRDLKKTLKSLTSELKPSDLIERELHFSDIEIRKPTQSKHSHYQALFNLNRSLSRESSADPKAWRVNTARESKRPTFLKVQALLNRYKHQASVGKPMF